MFPLRDLNPTKKPPLVTWGLIGLNTLSWIFLQGLGTEEALRASVETFGVVPSAVFDGTYGLPPLHTILTHMFMHGGWLHLIGNMWFLAVFGDNVEDVLGKDRFLLFYLLSGLAAFLLQFSMNPSSDIPMVGASGAISGVMAAYFLLFPSAPIHTLIIALGLWSVVFPAWFMIGYWFLLQLLGGITSIFSPTEVAFWAHLGGFLGGAVLTLLFLKPQRIREIRATYLRTRRFAARLPLRRAPALASSPPSSASPPPSPDNLPPPYKPRKDSDYFF